MFSFAHLSDPHIGPLPSPGLPALASKRVLGYLSWHTRRKAEHRPEVLQALVADLTAAVPDHVVVTGDVTNLALPGEFERAAAWLARLGAPAEVTVVPGNHEAYVAVPWVRSLAYLAPFMAGDGADEGAPDAGEAFPFVRRRAGVAFVGLSTAVPTPPFRATGRLGARQLGALEAVLADLGRRRLFRVVLLHHPPEPGVVRPRNRLLDAPDFGERLARAGAELVLHGHAHRQLRTELPGPAGPIPVLGVASASARGNKPGRYARYHLCRLAQTGEAWRLEVTVRGLDARRRGFATEERMSFTFPLPHAAAG